MAQNYQKTGSYEAPLSEDDSDIEEQEQYDNTPIDVKLTPLILACYLGRYDVIKILLQNELIDINKGSEDSDFTPLMVSCMSGFYEISSLLIQYGADVNKQNNSSLTPLLFCFSRLEEEHNHFENKRICIKLAELLLENGSDIDAIVNQEKQYTMLMVFCSVKYKLNQREQLVNAQMIKFLLQNGADPRKKSKKNRDCFKLIEKHSNKEEVNAILKNTKQINFHNHNRQMTLQEKPVKKIVCQIESNLSDGSQQQSQQQQRYQCCSILSWFH